jgi:hypothetical protein
MIPDELVEKIARAMCEEMGLDPDAYADVSERIVFRERNWHQRTREARIVIAAIRAMKDDTP